MIARTNLASVVGGLLAMLLLMAAPLVAHGQGHEGEDDHHPDEVEPAGPFPLGAGPAAMPPPPPLLLSQPANARQTITVEISLGGFDMVISCTQCGEPRPTVQLTLLLNGLRAGQGTLGHRKGFP